MTELEIIKWFLFGFIVGAAIASLFWKVYVEDHAGRVSAERD